MKRVTSLVGKLWELALFLLNKGFSFTKVVLSRARGLVEHLLDKVF